MMRPLTAVLLTSLLGLTILTAAEQAAPTPAPRAAAPAAQAPAAPVAPMTSRAVPAASPAAAPADHNALLKRYCVTCHSDRAKAGGLSLASFDTSKPTSDVVVAEKMIRKLRAGMMPPSGAKRPDEAALASLTTALETHIDRAASATRSGGRVVPAAEPRRIRARGPRPARARHRRLRVAAGRHHQRRVRQHRRRADVLADADGGVSARRQQGDRRSRSATPTPSPAEALYRVPKTASQMERVDGAPFGTRGGVSVIHTFPADGDYVFRMELHGNADGFLFGGPTTRRADRGVDRRRARRGGRRRPADDRRRPAGWR